MKRLGLLIALLALLAAACGGVNEHGHGHDHAQADLNEVQIVGNDGDELAHSSMPCSYATQSDMSFTSGGVQHFADYRFTAYYPWPIPDRLYFKIYHIVGGNWILQGWGYCSKHI